MNVPARTGCTCELMTAVAICRRDDRVSVIDRCRAARAALLDQTIFQRIDIGADRPSHRHHPYSCLRGHLSLAARPQKAEGDQRYVQGAGRSGLGPGSTAPRSEPSRRRPASERFVAFARSVVAAIEIAAPGPPPPRRAPRLPRARPIAVRSSRSEPTGPSVSAGGRSSDRQPSPALRARSRRP
jgi:hypothetical protein